MTTSSNESSGKAPPPLSERQSLLAMMIAMGVRNALEGTMHGGHLGELGLTDEQMALLNPIVRNAIATGLHASDLYATDFAARKYVDFELMLVPEYWEPPELLEEYTELWLRTSDPDVHCRRCGQLIVSMGLADRSRWIHRAPDGSLVVGCRAASLTSQDGWDDDLPRSWKAAPPR